ncbi:hypothetical protein I3760_14G126500 [Carya illinoinensis]|nr:hypothetical protein I3760_14G126500 [Carya illinoinensis]
MLSMMQRTSWMRLIPKPCDASWMLNFIPLKARNMGSSSGASINSSYPTRPEDDIILARRPLCYCGILAKLRTSGNPKSFGRRFFNCRYYKGQNQCTFFEWVDLVMSQSECCKRTLELAERRNERIADERARISDAKIRAVKKKYKCCLIASWVLFFALLVSLKLSKVNDNENRLMLY